MSMILSQNNQIRKFITQFLTLFPSKNLDLPYIEEADYQPTLQYCLFKSYINYKEEQYLSNYIYLSMLQQRQYLHPFITKKYGNTNYRILTSQFQTNVSAIKFCIHFLFNLSIVYAIMSVAEFTSLPYKKSVVLSVIFYSCASISKFTFNNKLYLPKTLTLSSLLLTLFSFGMLTISIINAKIYTYMACLYILGQVVIPWFHIPNRIEVLFKAIIMLQIIIICLKLDDRVDIQWYIILQFADTLITILFAFSLLILTYIIIAMKFYYSEQRKYRYYGLFFVVLMIWSLCCCVFVAPAYFIFKNGLQVISMITSICCSLGCFYTHKYQNHIEVFASNLEETKTYNQIISVYKIHSPHILRTKFMRKSQNLCIQSEQTTITCSQHHIKYEIGQYQTSARCLICMCSVANILWGDCGHLTTCQYCYKDLFKKKNIDCILCKKQPSIILKLQQTLKSNIYQVSQAYDVKLC